MPPKSRRQPRSRTSQTYSVHIVPIEQQLSREDEPNAVPQILKKLEIFYKEDRESLSSSLLHLIMRLCGLSDIIPSLADLTKNGSIEGVLEEIAENKINRVSAGSKAPLLILPKDPFYQEFCGRLSLFFNKLLSDDFPFLKEGAQNQMLQKLRTWLDILSKSKLRNIRYAAIETLRIFIENEVKLYSHYIQEKQSRKANQFSNDVEIYLKTTIKNRLKDVDAKIRDSVSTIIKMSIQVMDNDFSDDKILEEIFLPFLRQSNPKVQESALSTFTYLLKQAKKPKKLFSAFVIKFREEFQKLSVIPNKTGSLSLRILTEINKLMPDEGLLDPVHISRVFQFYGIQDYTSGLTTAIEAFFCSIEPEGTTQRLYQKKNLVMIEIANLINNFDSKTVKETIINHFFNYLPVDCKKIFSFSDLFQTIMMGEYNYDSQQVVLGEKEHMGWIEITCHYARFIQNKIMKYENFQDEKHKAMLQIWKPLGEEYNSHLLTNIKQIYHQKIEGKSSYLTKAYLELIGLLFLPIANHHQDYIEYLIEKMVALFEVQADSIVLKGIVDIFFNLKAFNVSALTLHISSPSRMSAETVIIKKLSILNKYPVPQYINKHFVEQIIQNFKNGSHNVKIDYIIGLFLIHQWYLNEILEQSLEENKFYAYRSIQKDVLSFLFKVIGDREQSEVKFAAVSVLCQMMTIICNDNLADVPSIYLDISEEDMISIYRFLDHEYGLPKVDEEAGKDRDQDTTRFFNSFDSLTFNVEKGIKLLFNLFENSFKIASLPSSLQIILGALMQEDETFDPDQTILKLNRSFEGDFKQNYFNICSREKLGSRYFEKLTDKEVEPENANRFIFWRFVSLVVKYKTTEQQKQKLLSRILNVYLKRKMNKDHQKIILNKTLLFIMYEFDRIKESSSFHELEHIQQILKRFSKRVTKEALRRVFVFFRSKYEEVIDISEQGKKGITSMITFMEKICKEDKNKSREQEEADSEQDKENDPNESLDVNERNLMRPIQQGPETRSRSKRQ